jgi:hypothetical protein
VYVDDAQSEEEPEQRKKDTTMAHRMKQPQRWLAMAAQAGVIRMDGAMQHHVSHRATTSLVRATEAQARATKAQVEEMAGATEAQVTWVTRAQPRRRSATQS